MAEHTERPLIRVDGAELAEDRYRVLTSAVVEQSVLVPDVFTLRFYDPDFELFDDEAFAIAGEVEISFSQGDKRVVVTNGEITAISVEPEPSGRHELVVSGFDRGHRLARGCKVRTFEEMTDGDIVGQIAQDHGLTAAADSTSTTYPWVVQTQTDYAFLDERARLTGHQWWIDGTTLHFKKQTKTGPGPTLRWPDDLDGFKVRFSASEAVDQVTITGWDPNTQESFVGTSTVKAGTDELGTGAKAAKAADEAMKPFGAEETNGLAPVADHTEAEALADSIARRGLADEVDARGVAVGQPDMKAGGEITVEGLGKKLSGTYALTDVEHVYRAGERYLTRFRAGGRRATSLVDLLGRSESRNPAAALGDRLMAGIVTATDDPDSAGRVKVTLPALGEDIESTWARMAAPGAGNGRGLLHYPEIGDEVLVGFENGNPRRPLVLGGLWSGPAPPPEAADEAIADDKVIHRVWQSRLGHKLLMSDGDGDDEKAMLLELSDGETRLRLGQDKVDLDTPTPLTVTGKDDITITTDANGVTINAKTITLKASGDVAIEGANVSIKGSAGVTIEGGKTDVKAQGMLNIEAGGIASVKGSLLKLN